MTEKGNEMEEETEGVRVYPNYPDEPFEKYLATLTDVVPGILDHMRVSYYCDYPIKPNRSRLGLKGVREAHRLLGSFRNEHGLV